jgi:hypothetical protein
VPQLLVTTLDNPFELTVRLWETTRLLAIREETSQLSANANPGVRPTTCAIIEVGIIHTTEVVERLVTGCARGHGSLQLIRRDRDSPSVLAESPFRGMHSANASEVDCRPSGGCRSKERDVVKVGRWSMSPSTLGAAEVGAQLITSLSASAGGGRRHVGSKEVKKKAWPCTHWEDG